VHGSLGPLPWQEKSGWLTYAKLSRYTPDRKIIQDVDAASNRIIIPMRDQKDLPEFIEAQEN